MKSRSIRRPVRAAFVTASILLGGASAMAESAATPARDPKAMAVVERMAQTIASAPALRVDGEMAWDVVQADGQTLEFGATRALVMQRPDRLRADLVLREGGERHLYYDGKQVALHDPEQNVYATLAKSGPVAEVAAFLGDRLGIPVALADLLSPDLAARLDAKIDSASFVGTETVDGEACEHVAVRNQDAGMQLWVSVKDSLPRRISITYEHAEGRPQFRARMTDWDLAPRVSDATFAFAPPKGAERISFAVQGAPAPKEGAR